MRKNKLMWNIALFLIAIVSIPVVHAQTFTGSSWFFIIINSLIVGVVLFILQSFLMQGKNDKEKTAVWVAIIAGSLLVGFLFGSQGFIWQHPVFAKFFSIYVLVNAVVIGIVLYFLSGFLDINKKLGSPEGKGGLGIIIFIIAVLFAVQIGNQWIWQKAVVRQFIDYLFGSQGILNPAPPEYRLWAFITVATLLSFFFNGFLLKGGAGGTNKVNYALAILIGSSVARAGISFASIVLLGEAIFTIVLADALRGTAPDVKGKSTNWILAAFLVGWASAAMTYGTEYQGWLAWIVGTPLWAMGLIQVGPTGAAAQPSGAGWFGWIAKMGLGALLIIGLPLLFFGFVIARGDKRVSRVRNWLKKYGLVPILRALRRSSVGPVQQVMKRMTVKDPYFEGELPQIFHDLRTELMILMNYQTRLHTYSGKRNGVKELLNQSKGIESDFDVAPKTYDEMSLSLDERYRLGGQGDFNKAYGWSTNKELLQLFFNGLKKDLSRRLTTGVTPETRKSIEESLEQVRTRIGSMKGNYSQFERNVRRFGNIHRLKSMRIHLIDLLALYGVYKHYYRFANENALFEKWKVDIDDSDSVLWSATPTKRDNDYEEEKEGIFESIKTPVLMSILTKKRKELTDNLYKIYYMQMWDETEKVIREGSKGKNLTENEIIIQIKSEISARKSEIRNKITAELRRRENELKEEARLELESKHVRKEILGQMPQKYKLDYVTILSNIGPVRHEIDIKGFVLEDIHQIEVNHVKNSFVRRVKIEDIEDFPGEHPEVSTFSYVIEQILSEWNFLIEDLRWGTYHPFSRSHYDYTEIIDKIKSMNFDNVGRTRPNKDQQKAAFDLEALKISGHWVYWGRKNYWDKEPVNKNPYPTLSTIGLSRFITALVNLRATNNEIADRYLSYWVWDTSRDDEIFTTLLGKEESK